MSKITIAAGLAAILAAGLFASAPVRAESVMKECGAEWKAAKAANTTNGATWQDFLKECKTRHASASASPAPAASPTPMAAPAPSPTPTTMAAPAPAPTPMHTRMAKATAAPSNQFANEGDAKFKCGGDTVVWVNNKSHKYHYAGNRSYGTTKSGGYMCENEAKAAGEVAAKNEKPKS